MFSKIPSIVILMMFMLLSQTEAQDIIIYDLVGPIIVAESTESATSNTLLTFQDLATGEIWQTEIEYRLHPFQAWTPDGCKIVLHNRNDLQRFYTMALTGQKIEPLQLMGIPSWSLDGIFMAVAQLSLGNDDGSEYYDASITVRDLIQSIDQLIFENDGWLGNLRWIGNDDLYFEVLNPEDHMIDRMLWSASNSETQHLQTIDEYIQSNSGNQQTFRISPDLQYIARFDDLSLTQSWDVNNEVALQGEVMLEIYDVREKTEQHVNVNDLEITDIVWSPTSNKIAILTDFFSSDRGIYTYDLESRALERIATTSYENGLSLPAWSSDGNLLTYLTDTGFVTYNIVDGRMIEMDPKLTGLRIEWSPILDYRGSSC